IPYSHQDYEVQSFLNLLNPLGYVPPQETEYPFIHTPATLVNKVAKILRPLSGKNLIALFPGASIIEKRWEDDKFVALADRLSQKGFAVVVLGMANEKQIGEKMIAGRCGLSLAGKTSLLETAAVILQSKMLISGDTGVLHIAAGLGVPTVSLFGPSNIEKWAPKGEQHVVLSRHLPCSPCSEFGYTPKCPVNGRCMSEITVDDVVTAVEKLLGRRRKISDFLG
ncbi:MAG TPA: glycosyltransferase family 9 protein, partial [Clostridia bacterium]